jgi:hypothetical protein
VNRRLFVNYHYGSFNGRLETADSI